MPNNMHSRDAFTPVLIIYASGKLYLNFISFFHTRRLKNSGSGINQFLKIGLSGVVHLIVLN